METIATLKISSQGQLTIPKSWRRVLKLAPGKRAVVTLIDLARGKSLLLTSQPKSWVKQVMGTGKGLWGQSDRYLEKERASWGK